jgi:uncharacterized membrane protein
MKVRRAVLSLGLAALAACPATAGADDQTKEPVGAKQPTANQPTAQQSTGAGFRVCNLTGQPVEVAKATYSPKRTASEVFVAEGWYQFEPGQCRVLWSGKLEYRYYLVYAQNKQAGREWKGDIPVCVGREAFTLKSATCRADQYRRLFEQVDTKASENWTHNLRP